MAACQALSRSLTVTRERSRWTGPLTRPCAPPTLSNRCLRNLMGRTSNCVTPISTTSRRKVSIDSSEARAPASSWQSDTGFNCAPCAARAWLAEQFGGEVFACDSTQLYRGFDIGTAKPGLAERRGIPHHLIDSLTPGEAATAGGYRERALV